MTATETRRPRTRTVQRAEAGVGHNSATVEMKKFGKTFYIRNRDKNEADREAKAARKSLYAEMKEKNISSFTFEALDGAKKLRLEAKIETAPSYELDVVKLRKLVTDEQFMQIVGATVAGIEKVAGKDILEKVKKPVPGTENVNVGPVS